MIHGRHAAHLAFTDYYRLLDVTPTGSEDEVKKSIRAKILEYHPDHNPDDPGATDRLREVLAAKELLTDPEKRKTYDGVYFAKTLKRYAGPQKRYVPPPSQDFTRPITEPPRTRYEEMVENARRSSRMTTDQDIQHLIADINAILSRSGETSGFWARQIRREVDRVHWGLLGSLFGGMAGLIFGLVTAQVVGTIILALMGAVAGWFLGTFMGELVSLIFLGVRILLAGYLLGIVASGIATGFWKIGSHAGTITMLTLGSLAGAGIQGFLRLGISSVKDRVRLLLGYSVVRQATTGAWAGALIMLFVLLMSGMQDDVGQRVVFWWFGMYTVYLILDSQIFGRPWIFI